MEYKLEIIGHRKITELCCAFQDGFIQSNTEGCTGGLLKGSLADMVQPLISRKSTWPSTTGYISIACNLRLNRIQYVLCSKTIVVIYRHVTSSFLTLVAFKLAEGHLYWKTFRIFMKLKIRRGHKSEFFSTTWTSLLK